MKTSRLSHQCSIDFESDKENTEKSPKNVLIFQHSLLLPQYNFPTYVQYLQQFAYRENRRAIVYRQVLYTSKQFRVHHDIRKTEIFQIKILLYHVTITNYFHICKFTIDIYHPGSKWKMWILRISHLSFRSLALAIIIIFSNLSDDSRKIDRSTI